jgi:elongation factor Ts
MAKVSIADIKTLREQLGTGMVDTKKALEEADGDLEKAIEILRLQGAKGNAKRADRAATEGLVAAAESNGSTTLIELACETDFVAKNEKFLALSEKVLAAVAAAGATTVEAGLQADVDGQTVEQLIADEAAVIGERSSSATSPPSRATRSRSTCTRRTRTCPLRSASSSPSRVTTPRRLARSRSTSRSPLRST